MRLDPGGFDIGIRPSWEEALASVEERGGKPYAIPAGASDHPLGGLGFARWAQEVADQEAELGVFFDTVITCSVTGSTQAGMIAGFALQDAERKVLGIDGSATVERTWNPCASQCWPCAEPPSSIQTSAAIRIEMRDRSLGGVLLAAGASRVIECDHRSRRFDAAINFGRSGNKSIPGQPHASA